MKLYDSVFYSHKKTATKEESFMYLILAYWSKLKSAPQTRCFPERTLLRRSWTILHDFFLCIILYTAWHILYLLELLADLYLHRGFSVVHAHMHVNVNVTMYCTRVDYCGCFGACSLHVSRHGGQISTCQPCRSTLVQTHCSRTHITLEHIDNSNVGLHNNMS